MADRLQEAIADDAETLAFPDGVILVPASSVKPERVCFAWEGRIPLGCLTLLVGEPGLGKTLAAVSWAAQASRGRLDGDLEAPCHVVYATAEDSHSHTLVPRLTVAGADLDAVHFAAICRDGLEDGLTLPRDVDGLARNVDGVQARLVVVDPIMAHLGDGIDAHRDHSIRRALAPLARMAEESGVAVLAIGHLNKRSGGNLISRVGGSIGFTAAARSILLVALDPEACDDDGARVLVHGKSNVSPLANAQRFRVEGCSMDHPGGQIDTARVVWGEEAPELSINDVLRAEGESGLSKVEEAATFLRESLGGGPAAQAALFDEAQKEGIAKKTLNRAKQKLGVVSTRVGEDGRRGGGRWYWSLPEKSGFDGQGGHNDNLDHLNLQHSLETHDSQGFDLDSQGDGPGEDGHLNRAPKNFRDSETLLLASQDAAELQWASHTPEFREAARECREPHEDSAHEAASADSTDGTREDDEPVTEPRFAGIAGPDRYAGMDWRQERAVRLRSIRARSEEECPTP